MADTQHDGGFAIGTYDQRLIEENAKDRFGPKYGDPNDRKKALKAGLIAENGSITDKGWDLLNRDMRKLELNSLQWLRNTFENARDEGHDSHDDLIGTFWFDLKKPKQVAMLDMGLGDRIDMTDSSYGDLDRLAWKGVSDFGASLLGGQINFFGIPKSIQEEISDLASPSRRRR